MEPEIESAAEPVADAQPVTASFDAASRGDFEAFEQAEKAEAKGEPLPKVEPAAAPRTISKRQQEQNDRVRDAVEKATADIRRENDELKARVAAPRTETAPAAKEEAAAPTPTQEWKRISALPGAPKLADFDSVEEHTAAMAFFFNATMHQERESALSDQQRHERVDTAQRAVVDGFVKQLDAAKTADPEFVTKLTPEVRALQPLVGGARGIIAAQVYESDVAPALLLHFSQNPQALLDMEAMPPRIAAMPAEMRARAHIQHMIREFGALQGSLRASATKSEPDPSTITNAPPPPRTLTKAGTSTDPMATALARDDFEAFDKLESAKERARRSGA